MLRRDPAEVYEGVRYSPERSQGQIESYFVKANDPSRRRAIWLKFTIFASDAHPDIGLAEAWAIAFDRENGHVAVKEATPYAKAFFASDRIDIRVDHSSLTASRTRGELKTGERSIAWDLEIRRRGPALVQFPRDWMYRAPFPSAKLVTPIPDFRATGKIYVNGEAWDVNEWPGALGHNWGRRHANAYSWGHCNVWEGEPGHIDGLILEGLTGRVQLGPFASPMTTLLCIRHRGVRYDLNGWSDLFRNVGKMTPRRWKFRGKNRLCEVDGEFWGESDDFVGLHYPNPDGRMTYCLNTKLASARVEITVRGRAPFVVRSRAAALEIGTHDPTHGIRMVL